MLCYTKFRKLADLICHDSNNAAFTVDIHACLQAAFVGIMHYANPKRMLALHASVCLWMFRIDHA